MGKFLLSTLMLLATVFATTAETKTDAITASNMGYNATVNYGAGTFTSNQSLIGTTKGTPSSQLITSSAEYTATEIRIDKNGTNLNMQMKSATPGVFYNTKSDGILKSISVTKSEVAAQNIYYTIYASNTAYTGTGTDYGTAIGDTRTSTSTIEIPDQYEYFCIVASKNGNKAATSYFKEFQIVWNDYNPNKCDTPVAKINDKAIVHGDKVVVDDELSFSCSTEGATISYTVRGGSYNGETQTYNGTPIKLDKIGIYTITAKATKDGMDASNELKIDDLDVEGKTPQMSFANASVYGKVNTGVVWQEVTVVEPATNRGTITYSSSDPDVVSIEAATGRIRPDDVKKAGVVTITATMAAEGNYAEGIASYQIIAIDPNITIEPDNTTFDFSVKDAYGLHSSSSKFESDFENPVTAISGANKTVSIVFAGKYRSFMASNAYQLRLQQSDKNSALTISVPDGYKITKIGITGNKVSPTYTPEGTNTSDGSGDNKNNYWEPKDGEVVNSVKLAATNDLVITKINVMWDAADSDLKPVQLTFTPNVNSIYVNEEIEINAVNNPNNREIIYSIPALDPEPETGTETGAAETEPTENEPKKYSIEKVDGKLKITVTVPGSYTLEARSKAGDGFRDGFAIMRLNVFRHLDVYANEELLSKDVILTNKENNVTMDVPENANLYYRIVSTQTPQPEAEDETTDENQEAGYELYNDGDGITIPANTQGTLDFYIANYGYKSPVRKIALTVETGVEEIEKAENAGVSRIYDLNGREIKGNPGKGIYILVKDGKAVKVVI